LLPFPNYLHHHGRSISARPFFPQSTTALYAGLPRRSVAAPSGCFDFSAVSIGCALGGGETGGAGSCRAWLDTWIDGRTG